MNGIGELERLRCSVAQFETIPLSSLTFHCLLQLLLEQKRSHVRIFTFNDQLALLRDKLL